ncbi:MAG: PilZ domain-containing protein [Magnetospirillum sp.]|nr:PilZ domain-containing protein [Magnetospirillum sp.]
MTHQFRKQRAAALIRSHEAGDRRLYHRFAESGMVVRLGTQLLDVHDLSIGGMRLSHGGVEPGTLVTVQLIPREGRKLMLPQTIEAKAKVIGQCNSWTRLRFEGMTFSLAKFLIQYMARRHGVEPYIFK